jgi:short-subunit dehydrogenase
MNKKKYTLITGASEGLGKAMAFECARRNMHLILVSLPGTQLLNLAIFIKKNFYVDVVVFEKNLANPDRCRELYDEIKQADLSVNMLINNAGVGGTEYFKEVNIDLLENQIKVNVLATTLLTRLFINELRENNPSFLLNVSSLGCFFYLPKKQVYGGTKSWIYFF